MRFGGLTLCANCARYFKQIKGQKPDRNFNDEEVLDEQCEDNCSPADCDNCQEDILLWMGLNTWCA